MKVYGLCLPPDSDIEDIKCGKSNFRRIVGRSDLHQGCSRVYRTSLIFFFRAVRSASLLNRSILRPLGVRRTRRPAQLLDVLGIMFDQSQLLALQELRLWVMFQFRAGRAFICASSSDSFPQIFPSLCRYNQDGSCIQF